ncbi:MAG: HAMP domain-containing sensor histidine kinase [Pirellulales bacterium]
MSTRIEAPEGPHRIAPASARSKPSMSFGDAASKDVLGGLAHDLRAHLALLESGLGQLRRERDERRREARWHLVDRTLDQTRAFVDDLVELGRSGQVQMDAERVELAAVVAAVLAEQQPLLEQRGIVVGVRGEPMAVWCNEARLRQVLTNLVRNAALHGCDIANPRLLVAWSPTSRPAWIRVRVIDNGLGIPAEHREMIFEAGKRLPGVRTPGSGMGLAIARRLVEHYGGAIAVNPHFQEGTSIEFTLPAAADRASTPHGR